MINSQNALTVFSVTKKISDLKSLLLTRCLSDPVCAKQWGK